MQIVITLLLAFVFACVSHSQNNHLFEGKYTLYVSAGHRKGKSIVSGIQVQAKDSMNHEIHVRMDLLKNWIPLDSAEFDLFLDTTKQVFIYVNGHEHEAIHYRSKDSSLEINFEKPREYQSKTKDGTDRTYWTSAYAAVKYSNRLKKYNRVLKVYYEK